MDPTVEAKKLEHGCRAPFKEPVRVYGTFQRNRGPDIDARMVRLSLEGHPHKGPSIYGNSQYRAVQGHAGSLQPRLFLTSRRLAVVLGSDLMRACGRPTFCEVF